MTHMSKDRRTLFGGLRLTLAAIAIGGAGALQAAPIVFSFTGSIDNATTGYAPGQAFTFAVTLDPAAPQNVRQVPAGTTCCASSLGWYEDVASQPNLWSAVAGTGITGNWSFPPNYVTTSSLTLVTSDPSRTPWRGDTLQVHSSNVALTQSSGASANGLEILDFQVSAAFLGLSAVNSYGYDNVFSSTLPDANDLFASMAGTYVRDTLFSSTAFLTVRDSTGSSTLRFTPDRVTITNIVPTTSVPEPTSLSLMALALLGLRTARRRQT